MKIYSVSRWKMMKIIWMKLIPELKQYWIFNARLDRTNATFPTDISRTAFISRRKTNKFSIEPNQFRSSRTIVLRAPHVYSIPLFLSGWYMEASYGNVRLDYELSPFIFYALAAIHLVNSLEVWRSFQTLLKKKLPLQLP